ALFGGTPPGGVYKPPLPPFPGPPAGPTPPVQPRPGRHPRPAVQPSPDLLPATPGSMIRKLLKRVFSGRPDTEREPQVIPFQQHGVSRDRISNSARKVVAGLQEAGFAAFVVGGAVRDLLLDLEPKDFDVATSATPE